MKQIATIVIAAVLVLTVLSVVPVPVAAEYNTVIVDDDGPADYTSIQSAIDGEPDGTKICVLPGTYDGFIVDERDDIIVEGKNKFGDVIVTGSVTAASYRGTYSLTIGVLDSTDIELKRLIVEAGYTDPFTIAYFDSTGKVMECDTGGNTGNSNPGNGIAAFGISSPGEVIIQKNTIHDYGKIGILVNSWNPADNAYVPGGIFANIMGNTIVGSDFEDFYRVQDGIQITNGGSAKIQKNEIYNNFQTGGSYWTCDGILIYDAHEVETRQNYIHDNRMGIAVQKYVTSWDSNHDTIEDSEWGIYSYNWIASAIEISHATIMYNEYGWVNWDTDGIQFEHCKINENDNGIYASAYATTNPTASFKKCEIKDNTVLDVDHDSNTLIFNSVDYDTYNNGGGILIET